MCVGKTLTKYVSVFYLSWTHLCSTLSVLGLDPPVLLPDGGSVDSLDL